MRIRSVYAELIEENVTVDAALPKVVVAIGVYVDGIFTP
jgi:hypothetical protein